MNLDFLSPSASKTLAACSPIVEAAFAMHPGATIESRDGWDVIASFGDPAAESRAIAEGVGFADLSHLTKIEAHSADSEGPPTGLATPTPGWWSCPVRRDLRLIVGREFAGGRSEAPLPSGAQTVDLTASLGAIAICGPAARETIARFCAIDTRERSLPVTGFRPGSIARNAGYLLREADQRFLLVFGAAYSIYMWKVIADAAGRLGGIPVGIDSLPLAQEDSHA